MKKKYLSNKKLTSSFTFSYSIHFQYTFLIVPHRLQEKKNYHFNYNTPGRLNKRNYAIKDSIAPTDETNATDKYEKYNVSNCMRLCPTDTTLHFWCGEYTTVKCSEIMKAHKRKKAFLRLYICCVYVCAFICTCNMYPRLYRQAASVERTADVFLKRVTDFV